MGKAKVRFLNPETRTKEKSPRDCVMTVSTGTSPWVMLLENYLACSIERSHRNLGIFGEQLMDTDWKSNFWGKSKQIEPFIPLIFNHFIPPKSQLRFSWIGLK